MPDEKNPSWELEAYAPHELDQLGADLTEVSTPLVLYNNRQKAIGSLNKRMLFVVPLVALYCLVLIMCQMYVMAAIYAAFFGILYLAVVRRFNKAVSPLLEIDQDGITVHSLMTHCRITWDNFDSARPYTFMYRFAGINPKSIWALEAPLLVKLFLCLNLVSKTFYGMFGTPVCVINIPEQYSHLKAEEICEQIELRRRHHLALGNETKLIQ